MTKLTQAKPAWKGQSGGGIPCDHFKKQHPLSMQPPQGGRLMAAEIAQKGAPKGGRAAADDLSDQ